MRFFPKLSLLCFFLTGIIYLAQLFPLTGIFLMMLAAPFWSIITINAGFILMTFESLIGAWPRWVLIFPLAYFGGYMALTGANHYTYYNLQKKIKAHNAQVKIPFNASENDLVLPFQMNANLFLTTYGLAAIYNASDHVRPRNYAINIIADQKACRGVNRFDFKKGISTSFSGSPDICVLKYPQDPEKPIYTVSITEKKTNSWLLPTHQRTIIIKGPGLKKYTLKGGSAAPYTWFPMPIMGCGLNSAAASWDCFHSFVRDRFQPLNKGGNSFLSDSVALAKSLGLKPVPKAEKYKPKNISIDISQIKQKIQQDQKEDAYTRFEKLLSTPVIYGDSYDDSLDFKIILSDQKYLESKASQMIRALDQLKNIDTYKAEKRRALSSIIAGLPLEIIQNNSTDLLNLFNAYEAKGWIRDNNKLFIRLGDLGPKVYPLLTKILHTNTANKSVAYAICRAGPKIRPLVGTELLFKFKRESRYRQHYDTKRALYMALARIGLRDTADKILTIKGTGVYRAGDDLISENSPATICVDVKGKPIYPD